MKKHMALLLILAVLALCGCEAGFVSGGQTTIPSNTEFPEVETNFDEPALAVQVSMGAEFEMVLDGTDTILSISPLNEAGQELLEKVDVVGQQYRTGIKSLLDEARAQNFLKTAGKVNISAREQYSGAWKIASNDMLLNPVEDYQKSSGMIFSCKVTPAGAVPDLSRLTKNIDRYDDYIVYYYTDGQNNVVYQEAVYNDGTVTYGYFRGTQEHTFITYTPNGIVTYDHKKGNIGTGYTVFPDGTREENICYYDDHNLMLKSVLKKADGSTTESFYENGLPVRQLQTPSDGAAFEVNYTYHSNGNWATMEIINPDGVHELTTFREDGTQESYVAQGDGVYSEIICNEDGSIKEIYNRGPDGTEIHETYQNGIPQKETRTYPNGDYENLTFHSNGMQASYISQMDGVYIECRYDVDGLIIYQLERLADGTEIQMEFISGEPVSSTIRYPDGRVETETFDKNG